jgi:hypothetical protein
VLTRRKETLNGLTDREEDCTLRVWNLQEEEISRGKAASLCNGD